MAFFFLALVFMFLGRKAGWAFSRGMLYDASRPTAILGCVAWGLAVAAVAQALIRWQHPGLFNKAIMGYGLGSYVSIPNFGLLNESTIPGQAMPRHNLISGVPLLVYMGASVAAAFWLS